MVYAAGYHPACDCQCLVEYRGYCVLYWNFLYECWDDVEGDDYFCDKEEIKRWIPVELLTELLDEIENQES